MQTTETPTPKKVLINRLIIAILALLSVIACALLPGQISKTKLEISAILPMCTIDIDWEAKRLQLESKKGKSTDTGPINDDDDFIFAPSPMEQLQSLKAYFTSPQIKSACSILIRTNRGDFKCTTIIEAEKFIVGGVGCSMIQEVPYEK